MDGAVGDRDTPFFQSGRDIQSLSPPHRHALEWFIFFLSLLRSLLFLSDDKRRRWRDRRWTDTLVGESQPGEAQVTSLLTVTICLCPLPFRLVSVEGAFKKQSSEVARRENQHQVLSRRPPAVTFLPSLTPVPSLRHLPIPWSASLDVCAGSVPTQGSTGPLGREPSTHNPVGPTARVPLGPQALLL